MTTKSTLSAKHPELFHYTSSDVIESVLRTQYLWATHWKYLNDDGELEHFKKLLPDLIRPSRVKYLNELFLNMVGFKEVVERHGGAEEVCRQEVEGLTKAMAESIVNPNRNEQIFDFYVTSLSTAEGAAEEVRENGLLSQWRYYGQNGGYALVFDSKQLENLMDLEAQSFPSQLSLGEVGYSNDSPDVLMSRVTGIVDLIGIFKTCQFRGEEECKELLSPMLQCFVHYKHWCFAEEREVRLVALLDGPKLREENKKQGIILKCRDRHFERGAPRIHLFEGLDVKDRPYRLPIKRIIVGPGPTQRERERKLYDLLDILGYDIPVTLADMPIRF